MNRFNPHPLLYLFIGKIGVLRFGVFIVCFLLAGGIGGATFIRNRSTTQVAPRPTQSVQTSATTPSSDDSPASTKTPSTDLALKTSGSPTKAPVTTKSTSSSPAPAQSSTTPSTQQTVPNPKALSWKPPTLTSPLTITVGSGYTQYNLDTTKDYIVIMPASQKIGGLTLNGGHNIVIMGGLITLPPASITDDAQGRGIYISGATGTVHIEGLYINNTYGGQGDGIAINAPSAIVQIQNVLMVNLKGAGSAAHADCVQPWGGVAQLRIDRFTCSNMYQGLQIPADLQPIGSATIKHTNLINLPNTIDPSTGGGYSLWLTKNGCGSAYPVSLSNVYITPKPGISLGKSIWPDIADPSCPAVLSGSQTYWPSLSSYITGSVNLGPPPGGDYVTPSDVGLGYSSPGYL